MSTTQTSQKDKNNMKVTYIVNSLVRFVIVEIPLIVMKTLVLYIFEKSLLESYDVKLGIDQVNNTMLCQSLKSARKREKSRREPLNVYENTKSVYKAYTAKHPIILCLVK